MANTRYELHSSDLRLGNPELGAWVHRTSDPDDEERNLERLLRKLGHEGARVTPGGIFIPRKDT
jgi:hypothetical protein